MRYLLLLVSLTFGGLPLARAQYPPGAGFPGTTALPADTSLFVSWAAGCTVERGPLRIDEPAQGAATLGLPENALGASVGTVVSLGDGGAATLTFDHPIRDGEGWDFAVFENGFPFADGYFLELAFVEVSSDGAHFLRFPAVSLTSSETQVGTFGLLDPEKLHNLAGKYEAGYGTPFDLAELPDHPDLNKERITHVRVIDVVGAIDPAYATYDTEGRPVNDPWPTVFESGGFDLAAIGVIHQDPETAVAEAEPAANWRVFPNPVSEGETLRVTAGAAPPISGQLFNSAGRLVRTFARERTIQTAGLPPGLYFLRVVRGRRSQTFKISIQ